MPPLDVPTSPDPDYPGVHRAYDFVLPSYQWLLARVESADNRLASVMTTASTLTLAAPVFLRTIRPDLSFSSPWFLGALGCFGLLVALATIGRLRGTLALVHPAKLYDLSLHESEWEAKKNAVYFAGQHFAHNRSVVATKARYGLVAALLLALEVLAFVAWLAQ